MSASAKSVLASLRPTHALKIRELVQEAGVDTSDWAIGHNGKPVKYPNSNPKYCYNWSFGGKNEPTVICLWYERIYEENGTISCKENMQAHAEKITLDKNQKYRLTQRPRAITVDKLVSEAYQSGLPIRTVILDGPKSEENNSYANSPVHRRKLDVAFWFVESYDNGTGEFKLTRSNPPAYESLLTDQYRDERFVDQFMTAEPAAKKEALLGLFLRSRQHRITVLGRAKGNCECCGQPGFLMNGNRVYLETHHVVPLSEGGPDLPWNMVAICPND
ncbi:MAG: HNH endonuclease, partial [Flavobacteriales bacterium]|nr:HNH endonuclease [Flavobacteriales bacterium]